MFRGLYHATSGMLAAERHHEILSHNLSNAQTPGYKADQAVMRAFPEILMARINGGNGQAGPLTGPGARLFGREQALIGSLHTGVYAQEGIPFFGQGPLVDTGRPLDLALIDDTLPVNPDTEARGHLFFAVQGEAGEMRYLRNGQLALDPEGYLTTADGYYVLDEALNPIYVGDEQFTVTADGRIFPGEAALADAPAGTPAEVRLWVGYTEQPHQLVREGHSLWRWAAEGEVGPFGEPIPVTDVPFLNDPDAPFGVQYQVRQGFIEQSNVDLSQTMTQMLVQYRQYEANQRVLQAYDRSMELAANQIGRLY